MKRVFVEDIYRLKNGSNVDLKAWVKKIKKFKNLTFIDITDSTGEIQAILDNNEIGRSTIPLLAAESSVRIKGKVEKNTKNKEIKIHSLEIIGGVYKSFTPAPRSDFDIFNPSLTELINKNKHIYIRNPKYIYLLRMRSNLLKTIRGWFDEKGYIELTAPVLTQNTLYEEDTALKIKINGRDLFLTQCVGYYLDASANALEKVYNIGPSFRGKESHTKRHLMEYWHIKSEIAFADLEDMIQETEKLIISLFKESKKYNRENLAIFKKNINRNFKRPFPRISYKDAITYLKKEGVKIKYGDHLGQDEEVMLAKKFKNTPFWITSNPRSLEPFPYALDPSDTDSVKTADLIANDGFGEILGVAEKISDIAMLEERMKEKNKLADKRYDWIKEVHQVGSVPHGAMGMGFERMFRWIFQIPHVKDTIPFPRTFRKVVYP